jgi:uncharacterized protein (DUF2147 family)
MRITQVLLGGIVSATLFVAFMVTLHADEPSPAGLWRTIDDSTGQTKGLVRIREVGGHLEGKIEKIFPRPGDDPAPRCDKCDGTRKNRPVLGMTILSGLAKQGDDYEGGEILDPENGKVYRAKLKLSDGGRKLEVRGFIGVSLFGRSQMWLREE